MTIIAKHQSGLGSVEPEILKAALARQLATQPDFMSHTEMGRDGRSAVLREFLAYGLVHFNGTDGRDECALQYRLASGAAPVVSKPVQLSSLGIPRRGGKQCIALHVEFEDHHRIIVHMPSGVEGLTGIRDNDQGKVYREAIADLAIYVAKLRGPVVITGDWNLSLRRRWVRRYFARHFPGFTTSWRAGNLPRLGTHGHRVIDFSLVRGFSVTAAYVVPSFGASDHRAISETHKEIPVTYPPPNPVYLGPAAHTSSGDNKPIHRIVIHATVSPCVEGGARSVARYFRSQSAGGSAHYVVDPGEVVQVVFDSVVAWHAPPNRNSLGNELCYRPTRVWVGFWRLPKPRRMLARAARLTAEQCLAYGVPPVRISVADLKAGRHGICGHVDVSEAFGESSHWDPGVFPWRRFMRLVRTEISNIKAGK